MLVFPTAFHDHREYGNLPSQRTSETEWSFLLLSQLLNPMYHLPPWTIRSVLRIGKPSLWSRSSFLRRENFSLRVGLRDDVTSSVLEEKSHANKKGEEQHLVTRGKKLMSQKAKILVDFPCINVRVSIIGHFSSRTQDSRCRSYDASSSLILDRTFLELSSIYGLRSELLRLLCIRWALKKQQYKSSKSVEILTHGSITGCEILKIFKSV